MARRKHKPDAEEGALQPKLGLTWGAPPDEPAAEADAPAVEPAPADEAPAEAEATPRHGSAQADAAPGATLPDQETEAPEAAPEAVPEPKAPRSLKIAAPVTPEAPAEPERPRSLKIAEPVTPEAAPEAVPETAALPKPRRPLKVGEPAASEAAPEAAPETAAPPKPRRPLKIAEPVTPEAAPGAAPEAAAPPKPRKPVKIVEPAAPETSAPGAAARQQESSGEARDADEFEEEALAGGADVGIADEPGEPKIHELGQIVMSVGQTLLEARGASNLTIAQVSQKTRVPKNYIEQLETDTLDKLPASIYTCAYIRQLCGAYSIEPAPVLDLYRKAVGLDGDHDEAADMVVTSEQTEAGPKVRYHPRSPHARFGGGRPLSATRIAVGAVIIVLAVVVLTAFVVQQLRHRRGTSDEPSAPPQPASAAVDTDLEDYIIPQQLPLKELPIPEN